MQMSWYPSVEVFDLAMMFSEGNYVDPNPNLFLGWTKKSVHPKIWLCLAIFLPCYEAGAGPAKMRILLRRDMLL